MYNHIKGKITEIAPTHIVVEAQGVGYFLHISLNTFTSIKDIKDECKILVHLVVREDVMILFGFFDENERHLFRHLISVSGIGPNTARVILSSIQAIDIINAIVQKNTSLLQSIKGIGGKTAQRIVVELHDKLSKENIISEFSTNIHNTSRQEALSALIVLGFSKINVEKVLDKLLTEETEISAEELIRKALKVL